MKACKAPQLAFNFDVVIATESPPPKPKSLPVPIALNAAKMNANDHRHWAALCRHKHGEMITKASEWPDHAEELAAIAKSWKDQALAHEVKANLLEGI